MKYFTKKIVLVALLCLSACSASPTYIKNTKDNSLLTIKTAYTTTINQAYKDSNRIWQHGKLGNITVNLEGEPNLGLCYHWQEIVYVGIQKSIKTTGWRATGIAINEGNFQEHHAVLVYNPSQTPFDFIFSKQHINNSYVLDPWQNGKPHIYTLENWLKLPFSTEKPARLTKITNFKLTRFKP